MMLRVYPLTCERKTEVFRPYDVLCDALAAASMNITTGDVVVASTKFVAISQGRVVRMEKVRASEESIRMSRRLRMGSRISELVLRESDDILGGMPGFALTYASGMMAPNAGIDTSNAGMGNAILYPSKPHHTAELLRRHILLDSGANTGVILSDSRLMPGRVGTVGVAVAHAGISPVRDMRGKMDLDGKPLKVTFQATADALAAAANHTMGEGSESRPFALIRGSGAVSANTQHTTQVDPSQCVYTRGLGR